MYKPLVIGDLIAKVPVVQGGMGVGVSLENLASAVAREGGIGVLSAAQIGYLEPDYEKNPVEVNLRAIGDKIKMAKEKAQGGIIGINIMVATKFYERYVEAAVKAGVDLIISGAGLPTELPKLVAGSKTKIAPIVSSIKSARVIFKMWDKKNNIVPDLLVIEGPKAGGHLGFSNEQIDTFTRESYEEEIKGIIEVVKEYESKYEKKIPVVVAGGIYDKSDVDYHMALGIDGVQVSTRFVTTVECDASDAYKEAYIKATKEDIVIVKSPVGMPGRAINNKFIENVNPDQKVVITKCYQCVKTCNQKDLPYCISKALINAVKGNTDDGLVFCGAEAYKATKIETVHEVINDLFGISDQTIKLA